MDNNVEITLTVNGQEVSRRIPARTNLVDFVRYELELTGSHVGCEHGVCGACTIRVNGDIVRGCLMLAAQADGATVETIEGVSDSSEIADLQRAFHERNALQCGFAHRAFCSRRKNCWRRTRPHRAMRFVRSFPATTVVARAIKPSSTRSSGLPANGKPPNNLGDSTEPPTARRC